MKKYIIFLIFFFPFFAQAQQLLSLQNAIDTALKNNFDIQIAKNNAEIGKIKNTFGFAGGMPIIAGSASDNNSLSNTYQELNGGTSSSENNVANNSIDAGVYASMVLFNGFRISATKKRLNSLQQQGELILNQQVQNTIAAIMVKYYDIIRQESYLKIIQNSLDVSHKKLEIINERDKVGMAKPADILQLQMDVNNAEQNLKLQLVVVERDKADLFLLMGTKQFNTFSVNDSIFIDNTLIMDSIVNYLDRNPQYLSAEQQIIINEQIVKEISSQRYPSIKINTGYDYNSYHKSSGAVLTNQIYGPSAGVTVQIPIYNGNTYNIQKKSAQFEVANATLEKENLLNMLKSNAVKTYLSYNTTLTQIESQKINYTLAKKLVDVVMQNFQVNQATILDVKAAQTTFEEAAYLLINLQYSAKTAEIELKRMIFKLDY
jgi:outer membrane protein